MESRASQNTHCNRCARYVFLLLCQKRGLGKLNHLTQIHTHKRNNRKTESSTTIQKKMESVIKANTAAL